MNYSQYPISPYFAELPRKYLQTMIKLVRELNELSENRTYQTLLHEQLPMTGCINPSHYAVMMGYDFHLSPTGPKLIEVNTNAGGLWLSCLCYQPTATAFPVPLGKKLLETFFSDYALFCKNPLARPKHIVILDEHPETQFLYAEMRCFAQLFRQAGIEATIAAPEALSRKTDGLYINGKRIDMIYNRHCDFYLETKNLSSVRDVWLNAKVCLSPNPWIYGLLADKRRMIIWSDAEQLIKLGLDEQTRSLFGQTIPQTLLLTSLSSAEAWRTRKQWVFKPDTGYGSRGVYVGDKLTTGKLAELNPATTLLQQRIPASLSHVSDELVFKTDFRLFTYRQQILAVSARFYQGQVTNLRTEHGGFAKVRLVK